MPFVRTYLRAFELIGPDARLGWMLVGGNLALAVAQFAAPFLLGLIVDALAGDGGRPAATSWGALAGIAGAWAGIVLFVIVCGALVALYADRLAHRRRQRVLTDYFEHVLQLPPRYHSKAETARLMQVMLTGTDTLWAFWLAFFREHLAAFISLVVLLPLTLFVNWRLAAVVIGFAVVFAPLSAWVMRRTETLQGALERHYKNVAERAADTVGNVALVQSFARIDIEVANLKNVVASLLGAQAPVLSWWAIATVLTRTASLLAMLAVVFAGIFLHFRARASVGEIVAFVNIAILMAGRLEQAARLTNRMVMEARHLREFFDVFAIVPAVRDRPDAFDPGRVRGLVEFKDASYSYDGKRAAVADLRFTALPGEIVALAGANGAGTSTALALLNRVYDPQSGVVSIDGMDIRGLTLVGLRRNIGAIFSETQLFNRSIAENLRVGKPDATNDEIRAACERAQAIDLIMRHAEGIEALVGEDGEFLSPGERLQVAIARTFLKDPPILIIDAETSALDEDAETKLKAALNELMKGRTSFVVAHDADTARNAARILVFEDGRVVQSGTFDELMRPRGHLPKLLRSPALARKSDAAE